MNYIIYSVNSDIYSYKDKMDRTKTLVAIIHFMVYGIGQIEQEATMAVTADRPAPYAPATAVLDIVGRYRNRGLIFPVTSDVLARAGISDSLIPRTLQALLTLDLIQENGNPTDTLEGIRLAPEAEYKKRLEAWLKGAYADVFAFVDPMKDDEVRIRDAFRSYQPVGQQARMVTLFQGLCAAAGLIPEKAASTPRPVATPRPRVPTPFVVRPKPVPKNNSAKTTTGLPPALSGLLESLPDASNGWTKEERTKFLTTFQAVLDFCIPTVTTPEKTENDSQE